MTFNTSSVDQGWDDIWPTAGEAGLANENVPVRFRILPRGTSWEVFRNSAFWGIFQSRAEANSHVRVAMSEIFSLGGSAQMRFC
jgi:hypothetical protein